VKGGCPAPQCRHVPASPNTKPGLRESELRDQRQGDEKTVACCWTESGDRVRKAQALSAGKTHVLGRHTGPIASKGRLRGGFRCVAVAPNAPTFARWHALYRYFPSKGCTLLVSGPSHRRIRGASKRPKTDRRAPACPGRARRTALNPDGSKLETGHGTATRCLTEAMTRVSSFAESGRRAGEAITFGKLDGLDVRPRADGAEGEPT